MAVSTLSFTAAGSEVARISGAGLSSLVPFHSGVVSSSSLFNSLGTNATSNPSSINGADDLMVSGRFGDRWICLRRQPHHYRRRLVE
jgi:hypothetical protein